MTLTNHGNGLGRTPPPLPGEGYLLVVRGPNVNAPGGIYYIDTFLDPLEGRSYDPPDRGSHGFERSTRNSTHLRLPLLLDNPPDALRGVTVQLYRLANPGLFMDGSPLLTADFFARNETAFQKVFEVSGESIAAMLGGAAPGPTPGPVTNAPVGTPTITAIHRSGSNGSKFNLGIIGDGFSSSATDQQNYQNYVNDVILDMFQTGMWRRDLECREHLPHRRDLAGQRNDHRECSGNCDHAAEHGTRVSLQRNLEPVLDGKGPNSDTIVEFCSRRSVLKPTRPSSS
jgi:hypothetical protein